jgi:hypothetical protein
MNPFNMSINETDVITAHMPYIFLFLKLGRARSLADIRPGDRGKAAESCGGIKYQSYLAGTPNASKADCSRNAPFSPHTMETGVHPVVRRWPGMKGGATVSAPNILHIASGTFIHSSVFNIGVDVSWPGHIIPIGEGEAFVPILQILKGSLAQLLQIREAVGFPRLLPCPAENREENSSEDGYDSYHH